MNRGVLAVGLLFTLPLLWLLYVSFGRTPHTVSSPLVGRAAPIFVLPQVGEEHKRVALTELLDSDKPIILNFWATWCVPCVQEHRVLHVAAERYGDEFQFIGVVYDDTREAIDAFLRKAGAS